MSYTRTRQQPKAMEYHHKGRIDSKPRPEPTHRDTRKPSTARRKDFTVPIRASKMGIPSLEEMTPISQLKRSGSHKKKPTHPSRGQDASTPGVAHGEVSTAPTRREEVPPTSKSPMVTPSQGPRKSKRTLPQPKPSAKAVRQQKSTMGKQSFQHSTMANGVHRDITVFPAGTVPVTPTRGPDAVAIGASHAKGMAGSAVRGTGIPGQHEVCGLCDVPLCPPRTH